ncbi:MAG: hypothetical protein EHM48_04225 [Planctomycetaceae bacterium]|nr:MAG: hypothetical protein EHM48_04225 [Planctomycetaceae bacterium]
MNDDFAKRVKSAAVAMWWTVLVAVIFSLIQWGVYMAVMSSKPDWLLCMFGPDMDWKTIQPLILHAIMAVKLGIVAMAMAAIWLSIWACWMKRA